MVVSLSIEALLGGRAERSKHYYSLSPRVIYKFIIYFSFWILTFSELSLLLQRFATSHHLNRFWKVSMFWKAKATILKRLKVDT